LEANCRCPRLQIFKNFTNNIFCAKAFKNLVSCKKTWFWFM